MRTLFILITLILCKLSLAQVYHPMPLTNSFWSGDDWGVHSSTCSWSNDRGYQTKGDTIINGLTYMKFNSTFDNAVCSIGCAGSCPSGFGSYYAGAIREDTAGRKIYFLKASSTLEAVLYDFTQHPGDTINSLLNKNSGCMKSTLLNIDSIQLNDGFHRRFNISNNGCLSTSVAFIEGIGSTDGLLTPLVSFENGSHLFCVVQNNVVLYHKGTNPCQQVTGISMTLQSPNKWVYVVKLI
jgi:hypothetical protein